MSPEAYRKRCIAIGIVASILVILIVITSIFLIKEIKLDNSLNKQTLVEEVYGTVKQVNNNTAIISLIDSDKEVEIVGNVQEGDIIAFEYDMKNDKMIADSLKVIASQEDYLGPNSTTPTTSTTNKTTSNTTKKSTTKTTTKVTSTTKKELNQEEIDNIAITYAKNQDSELTTSKDANLKEKAKATFIKIVDFIFYDGTINGVTWDELSSKAKAKIVYYALLIDAKIDSKWPNYKETISNKYQDIKSRLIAKYMDITTTICANHSTECEATKEDFALLKKSVSITWDIIKSAFKYGYGKTAAYLKNWYEIFSGKV